MSDAAKARAEARKKAILAGRTNRLAKLTSTARGEEAAAAFIRDAQAQEKVSTRDEQLREFVGETTSAGPSSRAVTPGGTGGGNGGGGGSGLDSPPPVWTSEQEELLRRIMGGTNLPDGPADPLAAMMTMFSGGPLGEILGGQAIPPALKNLGVGPADDSTTVVSPPPPPSYPTAPVQVASTPRTRPWLIRSLPVVHIIFMIVLCFWYMILAEPVAYASTLGESSFTSAWSRWASLATQQTDMIRPVPFASALIALELVLHSISVYYDPIVFEPSGIAGIVIPHLPEPLPAVIMHSMKYLKLGSALLDDLSIVVFIFGVTVWLGSFSGQ